LFFANANRVLNHVRGLLKHAGSAVRAVVVDLEASPEVDITSIQMLGQMNNELKAAGATLYFTNVPNRVLDLFERSGFLPQLSGTQICDEVSSAVKVAENTLPVHSG
jgi:MFS superfamily sulfate permease-like transporter